MIFSFTGCADKEPTMLDFHTYDKGDLFRLINHKVEIYGYFYLNPTQNNTAYIGEIPYQAISVEQQGSDMQYAEVNLMDTRIMAVCFKETPQYTSMPIKITGTLEAGPFTDGYYLKYDYRIKNATYEIIDFAYLDVNLQHFYKITERGYLDTLYSYFLDLEIFLSDYDKDKSKIPNIDDCNKMIKEFAEMERRTALEEVVYDLAEELKAIHTEIEKTHTDGTLDTKILLESMEKFYNNFNNFVISYGTLTPSYVENLEQ